MELTDGEILERFLQTRSEAEFEALVERHGRMVLGVCRRALRQEEDVEDAFQAVFALLLRNAPKLRGSPSVGGWLHQVAFHAALKARAQAARRREHERRAGEMRQNDAKQATERDWERLQPALDEELNRLPERLRAPLVLCCLEGAHQEEAARRLGWSEGQLRGRLAKAKEILRNRLTKRGVALSAAALFGMITEKASAAAIPAGWSSAAAKAATGYAASGAGAAGAASGNMASIAKGVADMMFWAKVKTAALGAVLTISLTAGAVLTGEAVSGKTDKGGEAAPVVKEEKAETAEPEKKQKEEAAEPAKERKAETPESAKEEKLAFRLVCASDIHGLYGGKAVYVLDDGQVSVQIVDKGCQNETRRALTLGADQLRELNALLLKHDTLHLKIELRPGVPDESACRLLVQGGSGEENSVRKWEKDAHASFDPVYNWLMALAEKAKDEPVVYQGKYNRAWKPTDGGGAK